MSDMRFIVAGIVLTFAGFVVFGIFGSTYANIIIQSDMFSECYNFEGSDNDIKDCNEAIVDTAWVAILVIALIVAGIVALIKGARGTWDQDVPEGDMVGSRYTNE